MMACSRHPPAWLRRRLPDYKWLRGVARGEFTGLHTDRVFLGRGSDRLLTIWLVRHVSSPRLSTKFARAIKVCRTQV
jgi:hypothetical protein